jgi:hypothetical protein
MGRPTPHQDEIRAGPCPVLWGCGDTPESPWHEIDRGSFEAKNHPRAANRFLWLDLCRSEGKSEWS